MKGSGPQTTFTRSWMRSGNESTTSHHAMLARSHFHSSQIAASTMSIKYQVFRSYFDRLVTLLRPCTEEVAIKAFSKGLISSSFLRENYDESQQDRTLRTRDLLIQILDKIECKESNFDDFISIIREISSLIDFADKLMREATTAAHGKLH